jgi:hypothetical protein
LPVTLGLHVDLPYYGYNPGVSGISYWLLAPIISNYWDSITLANQFHYRLNSYIVLPKMELSAEKMNLPMDFMWNVWWKKTIQMNGEFCIPPK